jgi:hypothetical protein
MKSLFDDEMYSVWNGKSGWRTDRLNTEKLNQIRYK